MPRKDKIRTIQEGLRAQRHGQSDPEVRPADGQNVRSVHGERKKFLCSVNFLLKMGFSFSFPRSSLADCYGGRYSISAIVCGEGTIDAFTGGGGVADAFADSESYTFFICTNVNARSCASVLAHTSN
jgi:hypothetical protein